VGRTLRDVPLLAQEKVRFVGEKVAAVAADDVDTAAEALTRIEVEYAELPAVFDPVEAMQPGAPLVHDGSPAYEGPAGLVHPHGHISHQTTWAGGDVEQGFRESDLLFAHTFTTPWVHQGSMEPYACMVVIDEAGRIQVWANNKQPFRLRWQLARALGLPEDRIRVHPCAIGGDFGGKAGAMDVPLAYALAPRGGRPVKMLMDYVEELLAGNPRHPAVITIKSGVKHDGQLWARHTRVVYNGGPTGGSEAR
jgi:putative selenate reductase molybdopterin-binding subunit